MARAACLAAEEAWLAHRRGCPPCAAGDARRKPGMLCPDGARLHQDRAWARRQLADERAAARLPMPGQDELPLGLPPATPGRSRTWSG